MNHVEPYVVEFPAGSGSGERWRIEFRTDGGLWWINNVSEGAAHHVFRLWRGQEPGRLIVCRQCPEGPAVDCPHDELPEQRGWRYTDMTVMRIMPMREAV